VAPVTTTVRGIPTEVVLTVKDGMRMICAVNLDNTQTVSKDNIGAFIAHISMNRMREIRTAIAFALGFDTLVTG
jgi:mRNA interferase MazF